MNTDKQNALTENILSAVFEVANTLGAGFLEKVYHRALIQELRSRGMQVIAEAAFRITYKGQFVGEYFADVLVDDTVVIELKCVDRLSNEHMAQCLNYLRASRKEICLLVNFNRPKVDWKRIVNSPQTEDTPG